MPPRTNFYYAHRGAFDGKLGREAKFCLRCYLPDCVGRTPDCPLTLADRGDPKALEWKAAVLAEVGDARELIAVHCEGMDDDDRTSRRSVVRCQALGMAQ